MTEYPHSPDYRFTAWLFLRMLGLVYFFALVSLAMQVTGLVGENGILPQKFLLQRVPAGALWERFYALPTLTLLDGSDGFLQLLCFVGAGLAVLLALDIAPKIMLIMLWSVYLSLVTVGQEFLGYQWDILLLETGFLSIFLPGWHLKPLGGLTRRVSPILVWLFRWLAFRLIFISGLVKITSGDQFWRSFTALNYHYFTQPIPHLFSWYAQQLPEWFQTFSCLAMFISEIFMGLMILSPRRGRLLALPFHVGLQILIVLTGNYCYFNWLTIGILFFLADDGIYGKRLPSRFALAPLLPVAKGRHALTLLLAVFILIPTGTRFLRFWGITPPDISIIRDVERFALRFRVAGGYGLFAVMTTKRDEIIVEGSSDGKDWKTYEFKYKPGEVNIAPKFVAPFQPRLDWQMWFAALGKFENNPWCKNFLIRLLQNKPEVTALLAHNPFPDWEPKYVRARLFSYRFTNFEEKSADGAWWQREEKGMYAGPVLLK